MRAKTHKARKVKAKTVHEIDEHRRLKAVLKEIVGLCDFRFDVEVALNFSGNLDDRGNLIDECSIDVAAYGENMGKSFLVIFECKGGKDLPEVQRKMSAWEANIQKIKGKETKIIYSEENSIKEKDFNKFDEIRVCYVFGANTSEEKFSQIASALAARNFFAWNNEALTYYKMTAGTIGKAAKYQILREFEINLESSSLILEHAIQIKQGEIDMFVFGAKPHDLLRIGYVSRRASGKPDAYQRILNKDRILKISEFVNSGEALLPNAIIIAFDRERDVQQAIKFKDGKLQFLNKYCSAWIIDGQHRVFGFLNTEHEDYNDDDNFKLPIVAFRDLEPILQNRTFVSINYNQKKIDPTLLCDLATELPDLKNELTWPSLLVTKLAKIEPLKDKVRISELHKGKPIGIPSFALYGLLEGLLGFDKKKRKYNGVLYNYAPFKPKDSADSKKNKEALEKQAELLQRYFLAVKQNTSKKSKKKDPWRNAKDYSLLKPTGINALLLVLARIMERYPNLEKDIRKDLGLYLKPLSKVRFTRRFVARQAGGWKGFRNLANVILEKINSENSDSLRLFGEREKL